MIEGALWREKCLESGGRTLEVFASLAGVASFCSERAMSSPREFGMRALAAKVRGHQHDGEFVAMTRRRALRAWYGSALSREGHAKRGEAQQLADKT